LEQGVAPFFMFVPHFPLNNIDLIKKQVTMNIDFITLTKDNIEKEKDQ